MSNYTILNLIAVAKENVATGTLAVKIGTLVLLAGSVLVILNTVTSDSSVDWTKVTATAADVLQGKYILKDASGTAVEGTIPDTTVVQNGLTIEAAPGYIKEQVSLQIDATQMPQANIRQLGTMIVSNAGWTGLYLEPIDTSVFPLPSCRMLDNMVIVESAGFISTSWTYTVPLCTAYVMKGDDCVWVDGAGYASYGILVDLKTVPATFTYSDDGKSVSWIKGWVSEAGSFTPTVSLGITLLDFTYCMDIIGEAPSSGSVSFTASGFAALGLATADGYYNQASLNYNGKPYYKHVDDSSMLLYWNSEYNRWTLGYGETPPGTEKAWPGATDTDDGSMMPPSGQQWIETLTMTMDGIVNFTEV